MADGPVEVNTAPRLTWAVPRTAVLEVAHAPRFAQRGRLRLTMADGSMLAVTTGVVRSGPAERFLRAWHAGPALPR